MFTRLLDGVEPATIDEIKHAVHHHKKVKSIVKVQARWVGHFLHVDLVVAVDPNLTLDEAVIITEEIEHELLDHIPFISNVIIGIDTEKIS